MVTYVLGAGASLHAGYPLTASLGDHLHRWSLRNDFMWCGLVDELHELYDVLMDLEKILTELYERPAGSRAATLNETHCGSIIGALRVAIPEFFNWVRLEPVDGPDSYRELARHKIRGGDVILTFNYDLSCERALRTEGLWEIGDGYGFSIGGDITPSSKVKVLKLHGSTNWLGILFGGITGGSYAPNVYGSRPCLFGENHFTYLGYSKDVRDPLCKGISTTGGERALILPTLHKDFFHQTPLGREWERFWNDIWNRAAEGLHSSERIVIIGYSMPSADERARELLLQRSNPRAEILVYSGSRTKTICEEFRVRGFHAVTSSGEGKFEDFLSG
jgi:hypothetical protein